jgi:hypothetical protein
LHSLGAVLSRYSTAHPSYYTAKLDRRAENLKMWQFPVLNLSLLPSFLRCCGYSRLCLSEYCLPSMRFQYVSVGDLATSAAAVNLYVSSYSGIVSSLQLSPSAKGPGIGGYSLISTASNNGSGPQPSWLTKDEYNAVI